MPTYVHKCKSCNYKFEIIQNIKDSKIKICPKCKKGKLRRLIVNGEHIFKAEGFYSTDYGGKNGK